MKTLIATSVTIVAAALTASVASSAPPAKQWWWTTDQANKAVLAQAGIGYCNVYQCVGGKPSIAGKLLEGRQATPIPIMDTFCRGDGPSIGGKFTRFDCSYTALNDMNEGSILVYTASATRIRWRKL